MSDEHLSQSSMLDDVDDVEAAPASRIEPADSQPPAVPERKHANELDGKTWTRYSISIWSDLRKTPEEITLGHPAMFPLALATRLIEMFTNRDGRIIFDPFAGVGSTVVAAKRLGKAGIGIELSPAFAERARARCEQQDMFDAANAAGSATIQTANALDLLDYVDAGTVDLVVTSPPYWDILSEKRTADYKEIRDYGDETADLSKIGDYHAFLLRLKQVFARVHTAMRPGAYCCVIVMDLRKKSTFYPFHSDIADFMRDIGFVYDDIIIWDRRHEYNNMRPLGYPSVFRVNKAHEFILIFQKPGRSIAPEPDNEGR
jgi:DNA modification methylase